MATEYCAVAAKLKAMNANALTDKDYDQILQIRSVGGVCSYLKSNTDYRDILRDANETAIHRTELELMVERKIKDEYIRLYRFCGLYDRKILRYLFVRDEIEFIKHKLRYIFNHESNRPNPEAEPVSDFFREHTSLDLEKIGKIADFDSFVEACQGTIYYDVLKRASDIDIDLFTVVMMLDGFYYQSLWKDADKYMSKPHEEQFKKYMGMVIDLLNILWIYRSKKYFNTPNDIVYTYLIPIRKNLTEENIANMVKSENVENVILEVSKTRYKELFDNITAESFIEENFKKMTYINAKRTFKLSSASMTTVFAYFRLRQIETNNITTVIEGIRYSFNADTISQLLIR